MLITQIASSSGYIYDVLDDVIYQSYFHRLLGIPLIHMYNNCTSVMLGETQRYRIVKWLYSAMYGYRAVVLSMVSNLWCVYSTIIGAGTP